MDEILLKEGDPQHCLSCNSKLSGRVGKKFCSDQCRAQYNNKRKTKEERWIQQLNRLLRKNRSVLKSLNPVGLSTVRLDVLLQMGFDTRFYTHQYITDKNTVYYFCYEWGYQVLDNDKVRIVNWQKYMKPASTTDQRPPG